MQRICPGGRSSSIAEPESGTKDFQSLMSAGHPVELETLYGDYPLDQAFDEMREPGGEVAPALPGAGRDAGAPAAR